MSFLLDIDKIKDTDELQTYFPRTENEGWEYKDAKLLQKKNHSALEKELAVQTSAFSNTRSGMLVFGYPDDNCTSPQPCEKCFGAEPMEHWLEKKIHMSVDPPLESAKVRAIPITGNSNEFVFVVSFQRSPLAPHQSKHDSLYYWRIGASSKPAPHSYLELLWNQTTKAVLKITDVVISFDGRLKADELGRSYDLSLVITLKINNISLMCASMWGVHYTIVSNPGWNRLHVALPTSGSLRPTQDHLLPDEQATITLTLQRIVGPTSTEKTQQLANILEDAGKLVIEFRPVSNNFIGEIIKLNLAEPHRQRELTNSLRKAWPEHFC
jgi:hypothetical protein